MLSPNKNIGTAHLQLLKNNFLKSIHPSKHHRNNKLERRILPNMKVTLTFLLLLLTSTFAHSPLQLKIVSGRNVKKGEFPYQVSFQFQSKTNSSVPSLHRCGGSILSRNWILTAAHCILPDEEYQIVAGITNLNDKHGQVIKVNKIIVHSEYKGDLMPNDIALLQLEKPLKLNNLVQTIPLPEAGAIATAGNFTVSGWGSTSTAHPKTNTYSSQLQTTELPFLSIDLCKQFIDRAVLSNDTKSIHKLDDKLNICTGPLESDIPGTCQGDSGGGLVQNGIVVGIVSWLFEPCNHGANVYTNVASFIPFIRENVKDLPK